MKREWKPGDIAILRDSLLEWPAVKDVRGWSALAPHIGWVSDGDSFTVVRPLVVIDPEDREAVERLVASLEALSFSVWGRGAVGAAQAALREFANPTPPKPEEPTGLGAVVQDRIGNWWIRHHNGWHHCDGNTETPQSYTDISAVRVLSEGVTA